MTGPTIDELFALDSPESDAVLETRLALYGAAVDEPQSLGTFTDEELAGLDEPGRAPTAPSPWFAALSEAEQVTALTAALRGLTARGFYRAEPVDVDAGTFSFRAAPELLALLSMRRYSGCIVVAERRLADSVDWAVLYEQRAGLWLGEYIDRIGQHEFVLADAERASEALTTWSGTRSKLPAPALNLVLSRDEVAGQDPELEPLGRCTAAVTVTRFDVDDVTVETWSGVFTGNEGAYVSVAVVDTDQVRYRGVARDGVLAHWRGVLGAL